MPEINMLISFLHAHTIRCIYIFFVLYFYSISDPFFFLFFLLCSQRTLQKKKKIRTFSSFMKKAKIIQKVEFSFHQSYVCSVCKYSNNRVWFSTIPGKLCVFFLFGFFLLLFLLMATLCHCSHTHKRTENAYNSTKLKKIIYLMM